jgi:Clustered mitochondria
VCACVDLVGLVWFVRSACALCVCACVGLVWFGLVWFVRSFWFGCFCHSAPTPTPHHHSKPFPPTHSHLISRCMVTPHRCRNGGKPVHLSMPIDVEGHVGRDGRYYVVDTHRVCPPEPPIRLIRGCHLVRLLRLVVASLARSVLLDYQVVCVKQASTHTHTHRFTDTQT